MSTNPYEGQLYFLQIPDPYPVAEPLSATAFGQGVATGFNLDGALLEAGGNLSATETKALVRNVTSVADAFAFGESLAGNPALEIPADLFTLTDSYSEMVGDDPTLGKVRAKSSAEVQATFEIDSSGTFAFDFDLLSDLESTEIESPLSQYSSGRGTNSIFIYETSDPSKPELIGYIAHKSVLISSEMKANVRIGYGFTTADGEFSEHRISFNNFSAGFEYALGQGEVAIDVDGNNGLDYVSTSLFPGYFEQFVEAGSRITVVHVDSHAARLVQDPLNGALGDGIVYGSLKADTINARIVYASMGNDNVTGTGRADIHEGGAGNDTLKGRGGDDKQHGGLGNDLVDGDGGNDELRGGPGRDTLKGDAGDDTLDGGDGRDLLRGGNDDDTLIGGDGNDTLKGEDGKDRLEGGDGRDVLVGGDDKDKLFGDDGHDELKGGDGNDRLKGGKGRDLLKGGNDNDRLWGQNQNDTLIGGTGVDDLDGGNGDDVLIGGRGDDNLTGGNGNDIFVLAKNHRIDTIMDFEVGTDLIGLKGLEFQDLSFSGNLISFGSRTLAALVGTDTATLVEDDFLTDDVSDLF